MEPLKRNLNGRRKKEERAADRVIRLNELDIELDENYRFWNRIQIQVYRKPADQALFLLLFHEMEGVGMCINGRKYLGNAPTLIAGPKTRMRFGVLGMGETFHTFHIHGHRWASPVRLARRTPRSSRARKSKPCRSFRIRLCSDPEAHLRSRLKKAKD